ncbi:MAG TPA: RDD family protein [Acidimicrobiales bacterium]|nr:RDD family protein [Acidimicrobiales bacterium]
MTEAEPPYRPSAAELAARPPLPPSLAEDPVLPNGLVVSSYGQRFFGSVLDAVLLVVLLGIGYLAWAVWAWSRGTSPGKQVLRMRVVDARTGDDVTWGRMFVREFVLEILVFTVVSFFTLGLLGLIGSGLIFAGQWRQTAWDRMAKTVVVGVSR